MKQEKTAEYRLEQALRKKFVVISFSVVFVVLLSITVVVNGFNYLQVILKAEDLIQIIAANGGTFPQAPMNFSTPDTGLQALRPNEPPNDNGILPEASPRVNEESFYTTRFFTVILDGENNVVNVDISNIHRVSAREAANLGVYTAEKKSISSMEDFYYCKVSQTNSDETLYIFLDIGEDLYFFHTFLHSSLWTTVVSLILVLLLLIFLSKKAVSPIVETYARQKEFITDMSHELKTPLAIVKANTEVLELEHGNSSWTESTHKQIEKLNRLIIRLLSLAKLEEDRVKGKPEEFSLSHLLEEAGGNLRVLAEQKGNTLSCDISENLLFVGDPVGFRQLMDILLENAVKYSVVGSEISLSLKQEKHSYRIMVINYGENLKKGSYDQWFQRFYREEASRNSETGGFGLGLSMAKTLVKQHDGKISAYSPDKQRIVLQIDLKHSANSKSSGHSHS